MFLNSPNPILPSQESLLALLYTGIFISALLSLSFLLPKVPAGTLLIFRCCHSLWGDCNRAARTFLLWAVGPWLTHSQFSVNPTLIHSKHMELLPPLPSYTHCLLAPCCNSWYYCCNFHNAKPLMVAAEVEYSGRGEVSSFPSTYFLVLGIGKSTSLLLPLYLMIHEVTKKMWPFIICFISTLWVTWWLTRVAVEQSSVLTKGDYQLGSDPGYRWPYLRQTSAPDIQFPTVWKSTIILDRLADNSPSKSLLVNKSWKLN